MRPAFECTQCGNSRLLLPEACAACGNTEAPHAHVEFWRVDLEKGAPKVDEALEYLNNIWITTCKLAEPKNAKDAK